MNNAMTNATAVAPAVMTPLAPVTVQPTVPRSAQS
jgi:hypothetical protein